MSTELPKGEKILRVRSMDKNSNSSAISSFYQIGSVNLKSLLIADFISVENAAIYFFKEFNTLYYAFD